jgi:hypothetical protein
MADRIMNAARKRDYDKITNTSSEALGNDAIIRAVYGDI